jgi:hypothetical protein
VGPHCTRILRSPVSLETWVTINALNFIQGKAEKVLAPSFGNLHVISANVPGQPVLHSLPWWYPTAPK